MAAALVGRRSRMLGLHINDGYGKRDDGLMVGSVHTVQTIELLRQLRRDGFAGTIYFDTFPDGSGIDPVAETAADVDAITLSVAEQTKAGGLVRGVGALAVTIAVVSNSVVKTGIAVYSGGWSFGRLVGLGLGAATVTGCPCSSRSRLRAAARWGATSWPHPPLWFDPTTTRSPSSSWKQPPRRPG